MDLYPYSPIPVDLFPRLTAHQVIVIAWVTLLMTVVLPLLYHMLLAALKNPCLVGIHNWVYSDAIDGPWVEQYDEHYHDYRKCTRCQVKQFDNRYHR